MASDQLIIFTGSDHPVRCTSTLSMSQPATTDGGDSVQCLPSTVLQLTQHDDLPSHMLRTLTTARYRPSQPEGTLMSPPHLVDRPNMASTPQAGFTQSCTDRYSFLFECSSELNDSILSDVPDVTSVLSEPVNVSTLSDFNLRCLFEPDPLDEDSQTKIKNVLENSAENCTHFCGISLTSTDNAVQPILVLCLILTCIHCLTWIPVLITRICTI